MAIAATVRDHLERNGIAYEVVTHPATPSASRTAQASHVSGERIAKGVVVKDARGYALAVVPSTHHVRLDELRGVLGREMELAREDEFAALFEDCDTGAVPAIGNAYGLEVVWDDSLAGEPEIYFEGGDHATLVRVSAQDFTRLMGDMAHGRFGAHD